MLSLPPAGFPRRAHRGPRSGPSGWSVAALATLVVSALAAAAVVGAPGPAGQLPPGVEEAAQSHSRQSAPTTTAGSGSAGDPGAEPGAWDPRVVDVVQFIEGERGLAFVRPVPIELLSAEDYVDEAGRSDSYGFYDGRRVVVRGTHLTPALEGTLVHELTHALDDQHFGIGGGRGGSFETQLAFDGLTEGDAIRMETAYDQMLIESGVDPAAVADEPLSELGDPPGGGEPFARTASPGSRARPAPGAVAARPGSGAAPATEPGRPYGTDIESLADAIDASPYYIGESMVDVLVRRRGNAAVDEAFDDPPRTLEEVLDPRSLLARSEPIDVARPVPAAPAGEVVTQVSAGALNLYLVLASGIDPVQALDAATGWGGESAVAYEDDAGRSCVEVAVAGDTEADSAEIGDAFANWVDSGVAVATSAQRSDGVQVLSACDLAGPAPGGVDPYAALALAEARGQQVRVGMERHGMGTAEAFAFGECVVHAVPFAVALSIDGWAEMDRAGSGCA